MTSEPLQEPNDNLILHCRQKIVSTNYSLQLQTNDTLGTLKGKLYIAMLDNGLRYKVLICQEQASGVDSYIAVFNFIREVRVI